MVEGLSTGGKVVNIREGFAGKFEKMEVITFFFEHRNLPFVPDIHSSLFLRTVMGPLTVFVLFLSSFKDTSSSCRTTRLTFDTTLHKTQRRAHPQYGVDEGIVKQDNQSDSIARSKREREMVLK